MELSDHKSSLFKLIEQQWNIFKAAHGRFPTSQEIDATRKLPAGQMVPTKTIHRHFGGLGKLRKMMGSDTLNFSSGASRSLVATNSMANALNEENELVRYLSERFGARPRVIPQERYLDTVRASSDAGVYHSDGHFFADVFAAKDFMSLRGCIIHKHKSIKNIQIADPIYFISSHPSISQETIDDLVKNKKHKLPENVKVVTMENFKEICSSLTAITP